MISVQQNNKQWGGEKGLLFLQGNQQERGLPGSLKLGCQPSVLSSLVFCTFASMHAYHYKKLKEEQRISLQQRRERLQKLLCEEREMLASELRELRLSKDAYLSEMRQKNEALKSAREERRKQVAPVGKLFSSTVLSKPRLSF